MYFVLLPRKRELICIRLIEVKNFMQQSFYQNVTEVLKFAEQW